jgi:hypothetical protein
MDQLSMITHFKLGILVNLADLSKTILLKEGGSGVSLNDLSTCWDTTIRLFTEQGQSIVNKMWNKLQEEEDQNVPKVIEFN